MRPTLAPTLAPMLATTLAVLAAAIFMVAGNGWNTTRPLPGDGAKPSPPIDGGPIVDAGAGRAPA